MHQRVVGEWNWFVEQAHPLRDQELVPEEWATRPETIVKQNIQRTVYRILTSCGPVYAKLLRTNTPRSLIRDWLRGPKAKLEADRLVRLLSLKINVPKLLGWGRGPGGSAILTAEVPNAVPLECVLERTLRPIEQRELARELGLFFGQLHHAGVIHPDPHPGNLLIANHQLVLLDTHAVEFDQTNKELDNLVLLNRWFQSRASATDRARFWQAYRTIHAAPLGMEDAAFRKRLETRTHESNLRFWQQRRKRYVTRNRQFQPLKISHWSGHRVTDASAELLAQLAPDPLGPFAPGTPFQRLKDGPSSTVILLPGGVLLKRFRVKNRLTLLKNLLRPSTAKRSWINGHSLLDRNVATARPLLLLEQRQRGVTGEAVLAFEYLPGAAELKPALQQADEIERLELIDKLARLLRSMHHVGVCHRDLKASNILVTVAGDPVLVDLVGVSLGTKVPDTIRQRDLARLAASFLRGDTIRNQHRLKFLLAYLGRVKCADWKDWWKKMVLQLNRKRQKNAESGRPLA